MLKLLLLLSVIIIRVSWQQLQSESLARYYFFHGYRYGRNSVHTLEEAAQILQHPNFDHAKKTVLYLHGYSESINSLNVFTMVNAYITNNDYNILIMDWSKYADGGYFMDAVPGMQELAPYASQSIISMFNAGLNITKFHLIGHSLGAQLAGLIGRHIINSTNHMYKLKRISALDAAGPGFYPHIFQMPLNQFDADFVDVIHTDAGVLGALVSTGTVDFWPNGGIAVQPGCSIVNPNGTRGLCSHRRSWIYWAESVQNQYYSQFHAVKANSWLDFIAGNTRKNDIGYMGLNANADMIGNYFVQTNSESPFSRGEQGLHFQTWRNTILDSR